MTPFPRHFDFTALNILGRNERKLSVSLNVEIIVPTDKGFIRASGHTDSDLAAGFLKSRIFLFNAPDQGDPVARFQYPGGTSRWFGLRSLDFGFFPTCLERSSRANLPSDSLSIFGLRTTRVR